MPIYGLNEEIDLNVKDKENKSIVPMFQSDRPGEELKAYIASYKWEVTYFHRVASNEDMVTQYDPNLDPAIQDYERIDNFIINVDTPLQTGTSDMSGDGYIDIDTTPNPNDLFIAKIADGKSIIFVITAVDKTDYNREPIYKIEYKLMAEIGGLDDPLLTTIINSTTNEYIYNDKYRIDKTQSIYTKEEKYSRDTMYRNINELVEYWSNKFITNKTNFYMGYVKDNKIVYDPQMETFIRSLIGVNNLNRKVEIVEFDDKKISILDYILDNNIPIKRINRYTSKINMNAISKDPYLFSLSYIQVDKIIDVISNPVTDKVNELINSYFPKVEQQTYIFRKPIYDNIITGLDITYDTHSKFEQLFLSMMNGTTIKQESILEIYDNIFSLDDEEQFYFIPILIYIMKYFITTFTVEFL